MSSLADGDLSKSIDAQYEGSFNQFKTDISNMQRRLSDVIERDVRGIVSAAVSGDLSQRINLEGKRGF